MTYSNSVPTPDAHEGVKIEGASNVKEENSMKQDELLRQIEEWLDSNEHQKIIDAIEALPREQWNYSLKCTLANAYIGVSAFGKPRLEDALSVLESVREAGEEDPAWNQFMAAALTVSGKTEAIFYARRAAELDPNNPNAVLFAQITEIFLSLFRYSDEERKAVERKISEHFGPVVNVLHKIRSLQIHFDVAVIPPSEVNNHYTIVTIGLGAYKMRHIPDDLAGYALERMELVVTLPPDWRLDEESLKDERWHWPIRNLLEIARMPICTDAWFICGHMIHPDSNKPLVDNTQLRGFILSDAHNSEGNKITANLPNGDIVNFYQLIPIYADEIEYANSYGPIALIDKLEDAEYYVVDPSRPSVIS